MFTTNQERIFTWDLERSFIGCNSWHWSEIFFGKLYVTNFYMLQIFWNYGIIIYSSFIIKQEAVEKRCSAGSTASVVLLLNDEELMVANVGDSKVILCAGKISPRGSSIIWHFILNLVVWKSTVWLDKNLQDMLKNWPVIIIQIEMMNEPE